LWCQLTKAFSNDRDVRWRPEWDLVEWLVAKGARLDWFHPNLHTTPAHIVASIYAWETQHPAGRSSAIMRTSDTTLLERILASNDVDQCVCFFSDGGCRVIACAVKQIVDDSSIYKNVEHSDLNFHNIFHAIDLNHSKPNTDALAIIRTLTFEKLGLTHTCCARLLSHNFGQTDEEAQDPHYVESKDIRCLESLMIEFQHSWGEHKGALQEYIENVWEPRMGEEVGSSYEECIKGLQETGVMLWEPYGPQPTMSGNKNKI
jgi:hypothetical protein